MCSSDLCCRRILALAIIGMVSQVELSSSSATHGNTPQHTATRVYLADNIERAVSQVKLTGVRSGTVACSTSSASSVCVAVCCSVLQCIAACCSLLQLVAGDIAASRVVASSRSI